MLTVNTYFQFITRICTGLIILPNWSFNWNLPIFKIADFRDWNLPIFKEYPDKKKQMYWILSFKKCSGRSMKVPILLGNYDQQTNQPTDRQTWGFIGKFHFQQGCYETIQSSLARKARPMDDIKHNSIYLCMTSHIYISAPTRDLIMVVRAYVYACDILSELCATELIFAHPPTFITTILCTIISPKSSAVRDFLLVNLCYFTRLYRIRALELRFAWYGFLIKPFGRI